MKEAQEAADKYQREEAAKKRMSEIKTPSDPGYETEVVLFGLTQKQIDESLVRRMRRTAKQVRTNTRHRS